MEGGSHYRTSEDAALAGGGGGAGEQSVLRIRIRCNPKVADHKPREIVSADSEASGRVSGEGLRVHESACGGGGDEKELASDHDATVESVNRRADEGGRSATPKAENGDRVVNAGPGGSSKRKLASKSPEIPTCPECGKTFRSDKSLFGHLRCHPERDYRGVNPPPNARKSLQSNAPPPMAKCPPAKDAPKGATATAAADDDEDPEAAAALILIHLSDAKHWGDPRTAAVAEQEETDADTKQVVRIYCDRIDSLGWNKNSNNGDEPTSSSCKKTKKRKLKELETVNYSNSSSSYGGSNRRYQCSICLKAFSSHQALGGHIASHNKQKCNPKEAAATTAGDNEGAKLNKQRDQELPHTNTVEVIKVAIPEHRCTSCNQTFQSGQALGGHKRRHFNELHQAPSSSSAENRSAPSSSPLESSESEKGGANNKLLHSSESDKGQNRSPFKFDLNEVPEH